MSRILITTFGSFGDLHPYMALGLELQRRGHRVTIASSAIHRAKVEADGLAYHAVRPDLQLDDRKFLADVMDARRGSERVIRFLARWVRETYADTIEAARGADVLVTHPATPAAVLVAQKLSLPWISTVLAPSLFLSAHDPPVPAQAPWLIRFRAVGPGFMKWLWDIGRRQTLAWLKPVVELRKELGLGAGEHPLFEGSHSPSLVLALFSRYLAAPQPDWPAQTQVTGFPFYDLGDCPSGLQRFLEDGAAPVVFTLGSSAVAAAGDFYVESLAAVKRLGCRAVFLTGPFSQQLPATLPPSVLAVPYAPHGAVFARAAAIVHQGGVGTTAQAMRSGRPMLVVPFSHDQFDNGERVRRLGAAEVLYRTRYNARRAAEMLGRLMGRPSYARAAAELGDTVRREDGTVAAVDAMEAAMEAGRCPN